MFWWNLHNPNFILILLSSWYSIFKGWNLIWINWFILWYSLIQSHFQLFLTIFVFFMDCSQNHHLIYHLFLSPIFRPNILFFAKFCYSKCVRFLNENCLYLMLQFFYFELFIWQYFNKFANHLTFLHLMICSYLKTKPIFTDLPITSYFMYVTDEQNQIYQSQINHKPLNHF